MELTDNNYTLTVRTKFVTKTVQEKELNFKYERKMVILIPEINDECIRFFNAWLPETTNDYYEIVSTIGAPIHSPCRLSVHRAPHAYSQEKHFLFVMSKGCEDDLLRFPEGRMMTLSVLPQSEDQEADFAKDSDTGNYHLVEA